MQDTIKDLRAKYIATGEAESYYQINNGLCEDFAMDVIALMGGYTDNLFDVETGNFTDDDDLIDVDLLKSYWNMAPPDNMSWDDVQAAGMGDASHVWVVCDKRHYDAECPEGVDSFLDLPIFKRYGVSYLRENGIAVDDVVTDDVVPAPVCPIQNPDCDSCLSISL